MLHGVLRSVQNEVSTLRSRVSSQQQALEESVIGRVAQVRTEIQQEQNHVEVLRSKIHDVQQRTRGELQALNAELTTHDEALSRATADLSALLHSSRAEIDALRCSQEKEFVGLKASLEQYLNSMDGQIEALNSQYMSPLNSLTRFLQREMMGGAGSGGGHT